MSIEVPVAFVQQYRGNFILLSQQRRSRLRRTAREDPDYLVGKAGYFDRIGATEMQQRVSRHQDTLLVNTPHSRRRVLLKDWEWADLIDRQDKVRLLADPTGKYTVNAVMAANRKYDDAVITALGGSAYSIDEDDAPSAVALPSAQKIAVASSGMTLAKALAAKELLDAAEVDPEMKRYMVVTAKQITNMLNTTEVKSADYNTVKALVAGQINEFLGFEWIRSERLKVDGSSNRLCYAYAQGAIGLAIGDDITVDVGPRRDKGNSVQVLVQLTTDATRIEDVQVVEIACAES